MEVVALTGMGQVKASFGSGEQLLAGPIEWIRLFKDAELVITTSFHGTAIALLFEKDFYSVIGSSEQGDSRMLSLLREVGAQDRALPLDSEALSVRNIDYAEITLRLDAFRKRSSEWLESKLESGLAESASSR